jgi:myo-inositol-1-phosphate synthase
MIRCAKLARDRGLVGAIDAPAMAFCKHPPRQVPDDEAFAELERFIREA